jgi:serine/threonine-protein kinase
MSEVTPESMPGSSAHAEGVVISGKYRLVAELGVGAMGTVWSATHQTLGHQVAIKFLLRSIMASEEARGRFDREARLAARLGEASRHITRVIDHGVTDDRVPYLVMELLRGEALSTRLKRERRLPLQITARIVQQLSRALHVAHSAGVIHRDLKPANIFLCTPEQGDDVDVKLLDFGIAKATTDADDETTGQGQILGTPSYMSPEQILNDKPVDVRDAKAFHALIREDALTGDRAPDVLIVDEALTGCSPFHGLAVARGRGLSAPTVALVRIEDALARTEAARLDLVLCGRSVVLGSLDRVLLLALRRCLMRRVSHAA